MAKYGSGIYGISKYGETPKIAFSVEPIQITVVDFSRVKLSWIQPSGNFSKFRIVRNQTQFPETAEDGIIIYEQSSTDGSSIEGQIPFVEFIDGTDNPGDLAITSGSQIYYRFFLFTNDKVWVNAGSTSDIIPFNTGATKKALDLFPRVITSKENSPFGVIDENTEIYQFIDSLGFTYEQFATFITLLRPQHKRDKSLYATIPAESLNYGLTIEPNLPVSNQHRLIREALYMYKERGTKTGLETFVESVTGYAPTVTVSPNLMLSIQDSTFYNSTGNWQATNATIEESEDQVAEPGDNVIDSTFSLKVTPSGIGSITLGYDSVVTKGVPVIESTEYSLNAQVKCPTSGQNLTLMAEFFDKDGVSVGTDDITIAANNTWQLLELVTTTPAGTSYAALTISWDDTDVFYVDEVFVGLTFESYDEARAITVALGPTKINHIKNPSFEIDDSTWTTSGATFSQDSSVPYDGYSGDYSGKFVAAGSWSTIADYQIPIELGSYFTFSFYAKSSDMETISAYVDTYDSDDNLVSGVQLSENLTSDWTRLSISKLVDSDSTESYAIVRLEGDAGTVYLDMLQFEDSFRASDYIDGSMPSQYGAIWTGTANESETYLYPNKLTKVPRLAQSMVEWVPMNSWWRITTPAGVEYTNLEV